MHDAEGMALGALVTRIFHDHTRLRLPLAPRIYPIRETEPAAIGRSILLPPPDDDDGFAEMGGGKP